MSSRTKRQHFVPRFYLANFADANGDVWCNDSQLDTARKNKPENVAIETNIYTPTDRDGNRIETIEQALANIESEASIVLPQLLEFRKLDSVSKLQFARFLAAMFARSPAMIRQLAELQAGMAFWAGARSLDIENSKKETEGSLENRYLNVHKIMGNPSGIHMKIDRNVGLNSFRMVETLTSLIQNMTWTFEITESQQLVTSDNPFFWVNGGPEKHQGPFGFGLAHRQAVVPFPLSPNLILRLDWVQSTGWTKHRLFKDRAKRANKFQATHKDRFLYFRDQDEAICKLGMKYSEPANQIVTDAEVPQMQVVRKR